MNKIHKKNLNTFIRELRVPCYDENKIKKKKPVKKSTSTDKNESKKVTKVQTLKKAKSSDITAGYKK